MERSSGTSKPAIEFEKGGVCEVGHQVRGTLWGNSPALFSQQHRQFSGDEGVLPELTFSSVQVRWRLFS
jgi:hypothetical protein